MLGPDDARASFVLAQLAQPGLDLAAWTRTIRNAMRHAPSCAIIGVCNQAGCFLALLRLSGGQVNVMVASAIVAGTERELICVARTVAIRPV
jgi:hypothetical protein